MAVVSIQAKLNTEDLFAVLEQLEPAEADKITRRLLSLQARRKAPCLSKREEELLGEIYRQKRPGFQERYDLLNAKRRDFSLTPHEHEELLQLVDESEAFTVRRIQALGELAELRQISVPILMKQLGLKTPSVV